MTRAQLHRLLHPMFRIAETDEVVRLEVSRFSLILTFTLPILLGYGPLIGILFVMRDRIPPEFFPLGWIAGLVPALFLAYVVSLLWKQRECLAFQKATREVRLPQWNAPVPLHRVRSLRVITHAKNLPEKSIPTTELTLEVANETGAVESHFVAGDIHSRLRRAGDELAARTGMNIDFSEAG